MSRAVCVHAHFYQPPRENPWLEAIELQTSAHPFHDWNQRITLECYAPNTAARILAPGNSIVGIVNNYQNISFNFGPTLLSWIERNEPDIYHEIIQADKVGREIYHGHGPAIAQGYNHMILPLANRRDKQTQVIWGLKDFEARFGRSAEGMWLPETAVDVETLEILAEQNLKFTILAPNQCRRVREIGKRRWIDTPNASADPKIPYLCRLPSGRSIVLFFYDGPISRDIAFGNLLDNGEHLASRLLNVLPPSCEGMLSHIATDGETYGHHHRMGDMALAYGLDHIRRRGLGEMMIYGLFLEKYPPMHEAEIVENSSWSCMHGVERWREHCGCHTGGHGGWNQTWRSPLRKALDWLREELIGIFEKHGYGVLKDPWLCRDEYIQIVLNREPEIVDRFINQHAIHPLDITEKVTVLKLLEMQRHAMLMYTSCGWFFSEISGIETVQILQYAARALQLAQEVSGQTLEATFVRMLSLASSNIPEFKNGAGVYERFVRPAVLDLAHVAAHYAVSSLFTEYADHANLYCYTVQLQKLERFSHDDHRLVLAKVLIRSNMTWEEEGFVYALLHLGGAHVYCWVKENHDEKFFAKMEHDMAPLFKRKEMAVLQHKLAEYFGHGPFSLKHLFKDEQRKVLFWALDKNLEEIEGLVREINKHRGPIMDVTKQLNMSVPRVLANTMAMMFDTDLMHALAQTPPDIKHLNELVKEVKVHQLEIDREMLSQLVRRKLDELMTQFLHDPQNGQILKTVDLILTSLEPLSLSLELWNAQNVYFQVGQKWFFVMKERIDEGSNAAQEWIVHFKRVGHLLKIREDVFQRESAVWH